MKYYFYYYLTLNIIMFILYGMDKRKARKHQWRIPERTLILGSLFGGALGSSLGMMIFHHKTRKPVFWAANGFALVLHAFLLWTIF